jgi:hypothetical protein
MEILYLHLTGLSKNIFIVIYLIEHHHHYQAQPGSGYADGLGTVARFSAPESVAFLDGGHVIVVADTGILIYVYICIVILIYGYICISMYIYMYTHVYVYVYIHIWTADMLLL